MESVIGKKLGKKAPKIDKRTFRLKTVLKSPAQLPPVPEKYDVDVALGTKMKNYMLGNDQWGNCVITTRANATWRFEYLSQRYQIPISTDDCLMQYWREQGAWVDSKLIRWLLRVFHAYPDNGLVMLDSLKNWREKGWTLNGKKYKIHAFAALQHKDIDDLKRAVYFLNGAMVGLAITQTAMNEFNSGEMWSLTYDNSFIGGHSTYVVGYNKTGPICITWGKRQQMTWQFYLKYCDEAYATVDAKNMWQPNDPIDCDRLKALLDEICK